MKTRSNNNKNKNKNNKTVKNMSNSFGYRLRSSVAYNRRLKRSKRRRLAPKPTFVIPEEYKDITATIDANAIRHNVDYLRKKSGTDIMPVLKANAYGHGVIGVSKILRAYGVKNIGVATLGEAIMLRESGDKGRIVAWLYDINGPEVKKAIMDNIEIAIIDDKFIKKIADMVPAKKKCKVHIFVDTGIDRAAIPYTLAVHSAKQIAANPKLELVGLMSHFIQSEYKNDPTTLKQLKLFRKLRYDIEVKNKIPIEHVHIANSGGCLNYNVSDFTLARPGLAVYGLDPSGKYNKHLQPVMTLTTKIIQIKNISKGSDVGYDNKYIAPKNIRICVAPIGYADIIPRSSSGKLYVFINGTKRKVLGRISMDQIVIEAKEGDKIGDEIFIFGDPTKGAKQTAYDVAKASNTITDELIIRTNYRVNLKYVNV